MKQKKTREAPTPKHNAEEKTKTKKKENQRDRLITMFVIEFVRVARRYGTTHVRNGDW